MCHVFPYFNNYSTRLMSQHERRFYHIVTNPSGFIIMHIRTAYPYVFQLHQNFIISWLRYFTFYKSHFSDTVHYGNFHLLFHFSFIFKFIIIV